MEAATSAGIDANDAWLDGSATTFLALIRADIGACAAGAIIRSSLQI